LINGKNLYDVSKDLSEDHDVAAAHPDIVAKMREHYDQWWKTIEDSVNRLSEIPIDADAEPTTFLTPADWQDVALDQQKLVREALARAGGWGLEVTKAGTYRFEVRRWPREADAAMTAALPPFKCVDGGLPAGKALPIAKVKLRVGNAEVSKEVAPDAKAVTFEFPLSSGSTKAQGWFLDKDGHEICGAYYLYVSRVK
jgi:arylsulfatase